MGSRESKGKFPQGCLWAVVVLVIFLGVGILASVIYVGSVNARYREVVARMEAEGIPTTLEEARGPAVPDEQCAATYLSEVGKIEKEIDQRLTDLKDSKTYQQGRPTAEEIEKMRPVYADHPELWETIRKAAGCSRYAWLVDYTFVEQPPSSFPPGATVFKGSEVLKDLRALFDSLTTGLAPLRLAEGKPDEALESLILAFRFVNLSEKEPLGTVYHLSLFAGAESAVGPAVKILQSGPVSPNKLETLEAELAKIDFMVNYRQMMEFEQLMLLELNREFRLRAQKWILPVDFYFKSSFLKALELNESFRNQAALDPKVEVNVGDLDWFTKTLVSTSPVLLESTCRAQRAARALRVLVALLRRDNPEEAPKADLSDLGLPSKATLDPFTGKPFQVSRDAESGFWEIEADGWVLGEVPK